MRRMTTMFAMVLLTGCTGQTARHADQTAALPGEESPATAGGQGAPRRLRCEYLENPLGIDRPAPRLSWELVDSRRDAVQTAYQVLVSDDLSRLQADTGNLWDSGKVKSDQSIHVAYAGRPLTSGLRVWWKVRVWDKARQPSPWSAPASWSMGLLQPSDWHAKWIGEAGPLPASVPTAPEPAIMLRRAFQTPSGIKRATLYATALGLYELHLNGQRVGDRLLAPEWTDYHTRVQYQTYDVTDLMVPGENVLGAILGDGWYTGRVGLSDIVPGGPSRCIYGRKPWLLVQAEIEFADGRTLRVASDENWRATTDGPIRASDILDGETYDARREISGWDQAGCNESAWRPAAVCELNAPQELGFTNVRGSADRAPALVAQPNEPIRVVAEVKPVAITEPRPGVYVYDLGQNMGGWCRLTLDGPPGAKVTLRHAEVLNPDGTIYTANLRGAKQTDSYTLRRGGPDVLEPHFTYHGFRYVEVTGLPQKPALDALVGRVFCSAAPIAGRFECSDPSLNKLLENIIWTQRANMPGVPTDCPQRDERLGWMGDILSFGQAGCFNLDMAAFFAKWVPDVRDAQAEDGRYPDFAPHPYDPDTRFSGVPAWGDAGVFVPWCAYVNYADRRLLAEHFDSARRWVDWIRANNPDLLWKNKRGNDYGDWLNADTLKLEGWATKGAGVPKDVFATMFFARSTEIVSRIATVLGRADEARQYADLARDIRAAFVNAYVAPDGRIEGDAQAGYAIALHFGLLPQDLRPAAVGHMLAGFDKYGGSISTGFHSTICLMNELARDGHADQAYRLLLNRGMPSWLYPVEHGATTIWERWDGYVEGRGFQDPGMNSFAHYAFGCVGEWMYRTIAGINPDDPEIQGASWRPGYKHFVLRPQPGGSLTWASGEYDSLYGTIRSSWRIQDGVLTYDVTIPPNSSATVYVPSSDPESVREEGGAPQRADRSRSHPGDAATKARGLAVEDSGSAIFELGAGTYRFLATP